MQPSGSDAFQGGTGDQAACGEVGMSKRELSCGLDCCLSLCFMYSVGATGHMHIAVFVPGLLCCLESSPYLDAVFLSLHLFPSSLSCASSEVTCTKESLPRPCADFGIGTARLPPSQGWGLRRCRAGLILGKRNKADQY